MVDTRDTWGLPEEPNGRKRTPSFCMNWRVYFQSLNGELTFHKDFPCNSDYPTAQSARSAALREVPKGTRIVRIDVVA